MPHRLHLVRAVSNTDTVDTLQSLLKQAQAGELTGLAFVSLHPAGGFTGDVVGAAKDHPFETIGLLRALEIKITPSL